MSQLIIEGGEIMATAPEGQSAAMSVSDFAEKLTGRSSGERSSILPDGIKATEIRGKTEIWIAQFTPRPYCFRWIANDSVAKYGPDTTYRKVTISLPYLITFAVFVQGKDGKTTLSGNNECFFSTKPFNWDTELFYPAMLNCSKFKVQKGNPLSWLCTQYLDRSFENEPDTSTRKLLAFEQLRFCLLESGFNYSSEHNEGSSWYTESRSVDPRIATVEEWEKATAGDPMFVLDVPWLPTGFNGGQVTDRIFELHQARQPGFESAGDLARLVFNHGMQVAPEKIAS